MADDDRKNPNGIVDKDDVQYTQEQQRAQELTLFAILSRLIAAVFFDYDAPLLQRIKSSLSLNVPLLREASRNTAKDVLDWTRRGSPFRAIFVVSVGTVAFLTLTGLLVFTLFFLAATFNAIIISILLSLAAAGGFLAIFFICIAAVYVGVLSLAAFAISTATISAVVAVFIATGWIGFFITVWLVAQKCIGLAKHSFSLTGSAVSAYSTAWHTRRQKA